MQNLVRQKEAELKQANAELEERGKLLYKTKVYTTQEATCSQQPALLTTTTCHQATQSPAANLSRCQHDADLSMCSHCGCAENVVIDVQVAIEQLQSELTASRKEEAVLREEAQRVRTRSVESASA
jgi:hypothetical protein